MFDTFIHRPAAPYPQTITKHEHRAPTDESVKLLREMEAKAREQIIKAHELKDNNFEAKILTEFDYMNDKYIVHIFFRLNGKEYRIEKPIPKGEFIFLKTPDFVNFIYEELAKVISFKLVTSSSKELDLIYDRGK